MQATISEAIKKPEYNEMARNPLMLSLLISVLGKLKHEASVTRAKVRGRDGVRGWGRVEE